MIDLKKEIGKLSDAEKILLLEDIWESISEKRKNKLSISQKKEIDRRLELEEKGEVRFYSLDEVRSRIKLLKHNV
jgi:putative addiction module component (TIGR02574 family)